MPQITPKRNHAEPKDNHAEPAGDAARRWPSSREDQVEPNESVALVERRCPAGDLGATPNGIITRRSLADAVDEFDRIIEAAQESKRAVYDLYRAQLQADGMSRVETKAEIAAFKKAMKLLHASDDERRSIEEVDRLALDIYAEVTLEVGTSVATRAPRAVRETMQRGRLDQADVGDDHADRHLADDPVDGGHDAHGPGSDGGAIPATTAPIRDRCSTNRRPTKSRVATEPASVADSTVLKPVPGSPIKRPDPQLVKIPAEDQVGTGHDSIEPAATTNAITPTAVLGTASAGPSQWSPASAGLVARSTHVTTPNTPEEAKWTKRISTPTVS